MEGRSIRVRWQLYTLDERRHEPVWPGHRRVHARHSHDELDLRNAQQLRRARQQPRRVRARRLARIRSPHAEPRPSLRPRDRPHRGGEPQHRRVRSDDVESDRRAGARQFRRESARGRADRGVGVQRSRRLHLSVGRSADGVECGQEQLPAARGLHLQAHGKLRSAGRRRTLHRAVSDSGCAGHHDRAQSNRVLAQHAGSGDQRQRAHVPGESDQSHSERPAARAGRIGPGFDDQPRQRAGERHGCGSRQSRVLAIQLRDRTSVPGRLPRRGVVSRSARTQLADPRNRELRAGAIPDAKPASRCRCRDVPDAGRFQSIRRSDARRAGEQRRHHLKAPIALSASAVRSQRHLHRRRHVLHRDEQRVECLSRDDLPRATSGSRTGSC